MDKPCPTCNNLEKLFKWLQKTEAIHTAPLKDIGIMCLEHKKVVGINLDKIQE